jgi:hypothetical protein
VIPREDDLLRIYCQLSEEDVVRTADGRIDMSKEMRLQNGKKVAEAGLNVDPNMCKLDDQELSALEVSLDLIASNSVK